MENIQKHFTFVNEQIAFHQSRAEIYKDKERRKNKHIETKNKFESLLEFIKKLKEQIDDLENQKSQNLPTQLSLVLTPEDIEGLPQEQQDELSFSEADLTEFSILKFIEKRGGIASLDQIIVDLYRETEEVQRRHIVTSKVYRMVKKGLAYAVPGKKGVYSINEISEEEAAEIFS